VEILQYKAIRHQCLKIPDIFGSFCSTLGDGNGSALDPRVSHSWRLEYCTNSDWWFKSFAATWSIVIYRS